MLPCTRRSPRGGKLIANRFPLVRAARLVAVALLAASCTSSPTAPTPAVRLTLAPSSVFQALTRDVSIKGMNSVDGVVSVSGAGVSVVRLREIDRVSPEVGATVTVAPDAPLGERTLTWTGANGQIGTGTLRVDRGLPSIEMIEPATFVAGTTTAVELLGRYFVPGETYVTLTLNRGLSVEDGSIVVQNDSALRFRLVADANAVLGPANVALHTGTVLFTDFGTIAVVPPAPSITSVTPASAAAGSTANVQIRGTNFTPGASVQAVGDGIRISSHSVASPANGATMSTSISATVVVDASATPGTRSIRVSTTGGSADGAFVVSGPIAPRPTIGSFAAFPGIIYRGSRSILEWRGITDASHCEINNGIGQVPCTNGATSVTPSQTTEYTLTVTGAGGREWTTVTVNVENPPPPPSGNMSAAHLPVPASPASKTPWWAGWW